MVMLALLVLLTVVVLAFFSYSSMQRQISNANSKQAAADLLAQGAVNSIISDFKQEIAAGSTSTTYGTNTVFIPLAQTNAAPILVGTSTNLPNLIKRSLNGVGFSPGVPSRAGASSTTNLSQNSRSISLARWNASVLLPKANTNSTDLTPTNFTAPDWIFVNRGGGNPTTWDIGLRYSNASTNTNAVVGRYAYAIYDEGGLLDVNVAGFPPESPSVLSSYKNNLASADLTQVGLTTNSIAALVGWRNTASAQPAGSFPSYSFNSASQTNFFKNASTNSTGFLHPANTSMLGGESDRMFISRQQLIQFLSSLADSGAQTKASIQNAAQYLGTFSRGLDQPSFAPDPNRPKIIGSYAPPVATSVDTYGGNNDGFGGDNLINPSFLSIRVANSFVRWDGTTAVVNEPLVKKRFALRRLSYLTFEGPSSTASAATKTALLNAGVSQATIDEGTPENILKCFGLTWDAATRAWKYNHGSAAIMTLSQVAAANREPDFVEMLKAAINVGSVAKGGPNLHKDQGNYQYTVDTTVDYNILQIAANLIDQSDFDSYPTQIQISSSAGLRTFRGVEDLPYFYRYHPMTVVTRLPSPLLSKNDTVIWTLTATTTKTTLYCAPGTNIADVGEAVYLLIPDVWNPHDSSTALNSPGNRPGRFRLTVVTQDPLAQTPAWDTGTLAKVNGDWYTSIPPDASIPKVLKPLVDDSTAFTFTDNGGKLFREPTLLWRADVPTGAAIQIPSGSLAGPYTDVNTGVAYSGVQIGKTPISYLGTVTGFSGTYKNGATTMPVTGSSCIFQANYLEPNQSVKPGGFAQYTFRLQYQDPSGNWITYDEKYPDFHGLGRPTLLVNKADISNNQWMNPYVSNQMNDCSTGYDPRTARFGIGTGASLNGSSPVSYSPFLEPGAAGNYNSGSGSGNQSFADSKPTIMVTQRPQADRGNKVNYSNIGMVTDTGGGANLQMRIFAGPGFSASNGHDEAPNEYDGLWSQNDASLRIQNRVNTGLVQFFYEDADGIGRRAMAAYADKTLLPTASPVGLPHATANTYASNSFGVGTPTAQNQSRPTILNRPFRSVAEMSYASRGGVWKQIDFFTPESGDTALLDAFCINDSPADALVAGKVNLNTRQPAVIKAILSGAYREEFANISATLPSGMLKTPLDATEASNVANKLVGLTSDSTSSWRGPLANVGQIVGRYVSNSALGGGASDAYVFNEPVSGVSYTYSGLSGTLDSTVYSSSSASAIQRLREASIRPLAAAGQVRVWNVMVDVVAQVGRFSPSANSLDQFTVEGEQRVWVHLAIDRLTGKVIDQQTEVVAE